MDRTPFRRYKKNVLRSFYQVVAVCLLSLLPFLARPASLQAQRARLGNGSYALPGAYRVGYPVLDPQSAAAVMGVTYGTFGAALRDDDSHHRLGVGLGLGATPLSWLGLAARVEGRHDWHQTASGGTDDGYLAQTRLMARAGVPLGRDFRLGGETAFWFPAAPSPERSLRATSLDLNLLAGYLPHRRPVGLFALVGFRLDRSAEALNRPDLLSPSDRLALGYSETNAALFGLALSLRFTAVELFGEWNWDYYLRESSEVPVGSPMRVAVGARYWPTRALQLQLLTGVSPTARPDLQATNLMLVEPRFFAGLQVGLQLPFEEIVPRGPEAEPVQPALLQGRVVDPDGNPVPGARVALLDKPPQRAAADRQAAAEREAIADPQGSFRLEEVTAGSATLTVTAEPWRPKTLELQLQPGDNPPLEILLEPEAMMLRGVVQAPSGAPIPDATVWIAAGEQRLEATTGEDGRYRFSDLPPGQMQLGVSAEGWGEQTQEIDTSPGGLLELDLQLERTLPQGQIRVQVSDFAGKPLAASVEIKPLGKLLKGDASGTFEVDVPPGDYRVVVRARGHRTQVRKARVEEKGVTVLVVNLRRKR